MKRWIRLALVCLLGLPALAQETVTVLVGLEGQPLAELSAGQGSGGAARAAVGRAMAVRRAEIVSQHEALRPRLAALGAEVVQQHDTLVNAMVVRLPADRLAELRALPGVTSARRERAHQRHLETSTPFLGAPTAWRSLPAGLTGRGMKIGIIDTGIDYTHAMFGGSGSVEDYDNNDPTRLEAGTFPTAKVVGGHDFVGDEYSGPGSTARPDPDPLDPPLAGHGSHVAGIAAGFGVLKSGETFTGNYTTLSDFGQFKVGPGVAPQASLYALKVFGEFGGTTDSIVIQALEWALDPNKDGNFSDRLDVVNLSLGSEFGEDLADDLEALAVNRLSRNGLLCVISAGNGGNTYFINGSPGSTSSALTVANSFDDGAAFQALKVTAPAEIAADYDFVEGAFTEPLNRTGPITGQLVYADPPNVCADVITNAAALSGKIALIDRGICFFVDKIRKAQAAGAIAVVMVNNQPGAPIIMGGDADDITIPGVMISRADGNVIKSQLANGVQVVLDAGVNTFRPELADRIAESSSRGPIAPTGRLKPDIAAPGTGINSTGVGTGTEGELLTGTSMSAPQVTGAAALLRQARPAWTPEDVKAGLMNTAVLMRDAEGDIYPESRVGAGRMDVSKAAANLLTARADGTNGQVSLAFGWQTVRQQTRLTNRIRLDNFGGTGVTFQASVSNTVKQSGVTLSLLTNNIIVGAGLGVLVPVVLEIDPAGIDHTGDDTSETTLNDRTRFGLPEASGQVWFTSASSRIHLPWHVVVRAAATFDVLALAVGLPTTNRFALPLPTRGPTGHRQPVVSGFLFGGSKGAISGFGAASDFPTKKSVAETRLWFGIALSEPWETPQRLFKSVDVEIDPVGGATASFSIINSTIGNVRAQEEYDTGSMNDAFVTAIRNEKAATDKLSAVHVLGGIEPGVRDTAIFNNSVLVHSVKASEIGITAAKTRFRYRINIDEGTVLSDWVNFDLAKPVLDPTPYGIDGTPFFDEGRGVLFNFDRSEATAAGFSATVSPRVLLLHHNNTAGAQMDNLRLDLGKADADNDTLPDLWELANLGELTSNATGDADGDGRTNAQEFAAGTNPLDVTLTGRTEAGAGATAGSAVLRWGSATGRFYTVERSSSLGGPFTPVRRRITATPPLNTFTLPDAAAGQPVYYRIMPD
jgi:subtilisin family serine protease